MSLPGYDKFYRDQRRMMNASAQSLPPTIANVGQLDELLSRPTDAVVETVRRLDGDFIVLGAAGKMGPTLSRMLRRALDATGRKSQVIAVSRFSSPAAREGF